MGQLFAIARHEGLETIALGDASGEPAELGPGHVIVTLLCDSAMRYRARLFNRAYLAEKGLELPEWLDLD